ncbi:hypothetical protein HOU02_gp316 [Caulobacter phage CcrBL9]|uniref:Uncharacterized protein n=1 Tax=Caulobacter phage CcrBL9 TaxID=2283270 RepID=A0A385EFG2_9CAUD|nr:hypothetical protein HOU02_gp316 [Caulobacter phage CcrBL9]AXQ69409.1 hypothetical protein CcrBL9_gp385 [Caulobacter phage CcrBL9]
MTKLRIIPLSLFQALKEQLPLTRLLRNFFVTGNAWGMFHANSHIVGATGKPKAVHPTKASAEKAAASMAKKHGGVFRPYKCVYCTGYHIGKNRPPEPPQDV